MNTSLPIYTDARGVESTRPPAGPLTLSAAIRARGLKDPKPRSVKSYNADQCRRTDRPKKFPDDGAMGRRIQIERQGPLFTFNAPDCIGDAQQFSSRGLTDWYVGEYCKLNYLKG